MTRSRLRILSLLPLLGVLVACGGDPSVSDSSTGTPDNPAGVVVSGGESGPYHGLEPSKPYHMPNITLTDTNGNDFNLVTDTAYPVTLVFFGYTHCPDVCPLVMSDLAQTMLQLPDDVQHKVQLVFVTTDPARDTPAVLHSYLARYNKDFVGVTGPLATIVKAADAMGVAIEGKQRLPTGGYDVGHGAQVIGFTGEQAPVLWTSGTPVKDMVSDIEKLAG